MLNLLNITDLSNWYIIDDGVMGGKSKSTHINLKDGIRFTGSISLANNGGFCSLRRKVKKEILSGDFSKVIVKTRGSSRDFEVLVKLKSGLTYRSSFSPGKKWGLFEMPLSDFIPTHRGKILNASPINHTAIPIEEVGIILADGHEGAFELEVCLFNLV